MYRYTTAVPTGYALFEVLSLLFRTSAAVGLSPGALLSNLGSKLRASGDRPGGALTLSVQMLIYRAFEGAPEIGGTLGPQEGKRQVERLDIAQGLSALACV